MPWRSSRLGLLLLAGVLMLPGTPAEARSRAKLRRLQQKGVRLLEQGRHGEAAEAFLRAVPLKPFSAGLHAGAARALAGSDRCDEALVHLLAWESLQPSASDEAEEVRGTCVSSLAEVGRLSVRPGDEEAEDARLRLSLGDAPIGEMPVDGLWLAPGGYSLEVRPRGHRRQRHRIEVVAGEETVVVLDAEGFIPKVELVLTVEPEGMRVLVDGRRVGTSPLSEPLLVQAGGHQLEVSDPDGLRAPEKRRIVVGTDGSQELTIELGPPRGQLLVRAPPGASLVVDGRPAAVHTKLDLTHGPHALAVRLEGHEPWERRVEVQAGELLEVLANPESTAVPALRLASWTSVALGVAAISAGLVYGLGARQSYDDLESRGGAGASPRELADVEDELGVSRLLVMTGAGAVGLGSVLFFVDAAADTRAGRP